MDEQMELFNEEEETHETIERIAALLEQFKKEQEKTMEDLAKIEEILDIEND